MARQGLGNQTLLSLKKRSLSNYRGVMLHSVANIDSRVRRKRDGLRRGVGFVHFLSLWSASKVRSTLVLQTLKPSHTPLSHQHKHAQPQELIVSRPLMDPAEGGAQSASSRAWLPWLMSLPSIPWKRRERERGAKEWERNRGRLIAETDLCPMRFGKSQPARTSVPCWKLIPPR